jgi:hypothetical protein
MTTIRVPLDAKVRELYDEVHRLSQEQFMGQVGVSTDPSGIRVSINSVLISVVLNADGCP